MKFLYVATERQAAEQAGLALRSVGPDVAVSWAAGLGQARRWIDENRNVAALIVEVESDSRSFEALITHARGIGVKVPVIGIPLNNTSDVLMSVSAVADEVVSRNAAFLDELPRAVSRILYLGKPQVQQIAVPPQDDLLQRRLRETEVAAARAEQRAQEQIEQLRAREEKLQQIIEQERADRSGLERRFRDLESARQKAEAAQRDADLGRIRDASAFTEDLSRRDMELAEARATRQTLEGKLSDALSELERARQSESDTRSDEIESLQQELSEAKRILRLADQLHATTKIDAEGRIRDIQEQTDARLAEAASVTKALQRELADTVLALRDLERTSSEQRDALARQLADQEAVRDRAQRQLEEQHASAIASARRALEAAEQRARQQQTDAATSAQALETRLAELVGNADRLRVQLSETEFALANAEQQAAAERQAAADKVAQQQAAFDGALAQEVIRRRKLESQHADSDLAHRDAIERLEAARQDLDARLLAAHGARHQLEEQHAAAIAAARGALEDAEQQAHRRQAEAKAAALALETKLTESIATADGLRGQLSETVAALENAERQRVGDRQAAVDEAQRLEAQFDSKLAEAAAAIDTLRREVAETAAARTRAEQQAASDRQAAADESARREAEFDALLGREAAKANALEAQLADERASRKLIEQQHAVAINHAALRLAEHQRADARAAQAASALSALQAKFAEQAATLLETRRQANSDRDAATEQAAQRQAQFDTELAAEVARRQNLATKLTEAEAAQHEAKTRHAQLAATIATLETKLAESTAAQHSAVSQAALDRQEFDASLAREIANTQAVAKQLAEAEQQHAAAMATADAMLAEHRRNAAAQLADHQQQAERQTIELQQQAEARLAAYKKQADAQLREQQQQADLRLAKFEQSADERLAEATAHAAATLEAALQQAQAERQAATEQAAQRQAQFDTELAEEVARRQNLAAKLTEAQAAQRQAKARQSELAATIETLEIKLAESTAAQHSAVSQAALDREEFDASLADYKKQADAQLREQQQEADIRLAEYQQTAEARLAEATANAAATLEAALQRAQSERQAAAEQAAQRQAQFDTALAQEIAQRQNLAAKLTEAQAAQREAKARHAELAATIATLEIKLAEATGALQSAVSRAAKDREEFDASLAREIANTQAVANQLAEQEALYTTDLATVREQFASYRLQSESKFAETEQRHAWAMAAADATLTEQRRSAATELADLQQHTERQMTELQQQTAVRLADLKKQADAQLREQQQQADSRLAEQQQNADALLAEAMADAAATLEAARQQAAAERQAAAEQAAQRQARFDTELAQEVALRQSLAAKLTEAVAAQQKAASDHAAALTAAREQLSQQQQEAETRHAQLASALETLQIKLADTTAVLRNTETLAASDRRAAEKRAATQQAEFEALQQRLTEAQQHADAQLKEAAANRQALETQLFNERQARQRAEIQSASALAAAREQFASYQQKSEAKFAEAEQQHAALEATLAFARQSIAEGQAQIQQLEAANAEGRTQLSALQQTFEQAKATAQQSLETLSRDHTSERARLQAIVAERDAQLQEQAARHEDAKEVTGLAMAALERRLQTATEAGQRDAQSIKRLEEQVAVLGKDLEALNRQRNLLKAEADRVPVLQKLINDTQAEHRHRFEHTPIGLWRSRRDGSIVQANQALVSLLRYKTLDELLSVNFSTTVFESADELQWLVDRCLASRTTETVETTWRRSDGVGLVVRLMAIATSPEAVDFVAMDITMLRALEEKLRNSQRMESVARYASEVAVTCNKLLGQVNQQGQQWLTRIESAAARHQGALLLDDVTRAAGFLGQLTVYDTEQRNVPELVEIKQVLRDLEPILTRVAGNRVDIVVPKSSPPYHVDVDIERVERILVNVAAYGRERMPYGGRLMIDVSPVVVDRTFVDKYPNVRPGAHVLLTVTEKKGANGPDLSMTVRNEAAGGNGGARPGPKPGVDLGVLQALVNDCGGHLWILAEPSGNMELRIRLPRRVLDDRAPAKKAARGGWIGKLAARRREAV